MFNSDCKSVCVCILTSFEVGLSLQRSCVFFGSWDLIQLPGSTSQTAGCSFYQEVVGSYGAPWGGVTLQLFLGSWHRTQKNRSQSNVVVRFVLCLFLLHSLLQIVTQLLLSFRYFPHHLSSTPFRSFSSLSASLSLYFLCFSLCNALHHCISSLHLSPFLQPI